ncbi:MAG: SLC13 family permease [Anaerolineales bacterium]|nr:SLC13 family permease [Anaerolineales bacterium]MCB9126587.1 SLC13 family permease [Ardenticatenales bacterium]MCB9172487.1 SLC13 family permease [Ardenticatenales bacterium]
MSTDILIVLAILAVTTVLLIRETIRVDLLSLLVMGVLVVVGILTPMEAVAGFANPATLTVAAMFVLSAALQRTGALNRMAQKMMAVAGESENRLLVTLMAVVAFLSAFINNTAAVAVFLPITIRMAERIKISPSRLLMPLAFAAIFGGRCTLIGTSTNILVSSMAVERGLDGFGMFEFAPLGLIYVGIGILYMLLIGGRLLPDRTANQPLVERYGLREFLTEVVLLPGSPLVGRRLDEVDDLTEANLRIVSRKQQGFGQQIPGRHEFLQEGDELIISGNAHTILRSRAQQGWKLLPEAALGDILLDEEQNALTEVIVAPGSRLVGQTLRTSGFRRRYGAMVVGMQHHGRLIGEQLADVPMEVGDLLLLYGARDDLRALVDEPDLLITRDVNVPSVRSRKAPFTLLVIALVVFLAAFNIVNIVIGAIMGAVVLVLGGVISAEEGYQSLDAPVLIMLAAILSLGVAMDKSGTAKLLADEAVRFAGPYGPHALVATTFAITTALTNIMSNNAAAALLTPIAISIANSFGISPVPLLMAVAFAAAASLATPVGYQTNLMVYGPGGYRFSDYTRVGLPLSLILWLVSVIMIPLLWPF